MHSTQKQVYKYYETVRNKSLVELSKNDIVITTYSIVSTEFNNMKKSIFSFESTFEQQSPLLQIDWFRIVLDEAHFIRAQGTKTFASVCELKSKHKVCQNQTSICAVLLTFDSKQSGLSPEHRFKIQFQICSV